MDRRCTRNARALSGPSGGPYRRYVPARPHRPRSAMPPLRTALLQNSGRPGHVAENIEVLDGAARRAADAGARLLVCPELFLTGYAIGAEVDRLAEPADGPSALAVGEIA